MPNPVVSSNISNVKILIDETRRLKFGDCATGNLRMRRGANFRRVPRMFGLTSARYVWKIQYRKLGERRKDSVEVKSRETEESEKFFIKGNSLARQKRKFFISRTRSGCGSTD